jgi:putative NADH-flavin reductase
MPVIVVGADTNVGLAIIDALYRPQREVRAFVSDEKVAGRLRQMTIKVALGDVSDDTYIEAAATRCFSAVLVAEAATDDRERSFAASPQQVLEGWGRAIAAAGVTRAIWVIKGEPPHPTVREAAVVDSEDPDVPKKVVALDDALTI